MHDNALLSILHKHVNGNELSIALLRICSAAIRRVFLRRNLFMAAGLPGLGRGAQAKRGRGWRLTLDLTRMSLSGTQSVCLLSTGLGDTDQHTDCHRHDDK